MTSSFCIFIRAFYDLTLPVFRHLALEADGEQSPGDTSQLLQHLWTVPQLVLCSQFDASLALNLIQNPLGKTVGR